MHLGATISAFFHVIVIIVVVMGLPSILQSERSEFVPISIEVVTADELPKNKSAKLPPKKKPLSPPSTKKLTVSSSRISAPLASDTVKPDMMRKETSSLQEKKVGRIPEKKVSLKKLTPKPKIKPKAVPKPKSKPKTITTKLAARAQYVPKPKRKPKPLPDALSPQSLLKNLQVKKPTQENDISRLVKDALKQTSDQSVQSPIDQRRIAASLAASITRQLSRCYNILSGAKNASNMRVTIKVLLNPDGSLRGTPRVKESMGVIRDGFYRAAKESALRTLRNPSCMPLKLPYDHYNLWKETTVTFDPKEMLR